VSGTYAMKDAFLEATGHILPTAISGILGIFKGFNWSFLTASFCLATIYYIKLRGHLLIGGRTTCCIWDVNINRYTYQYVRHYFVKILLGGEHHVDLLDPLIQWNHISSNLNHLTIILVRLILIWNLIHIKFKLI